MNSEIKENIINTANVMVAEGVQDPTNKQVLGRMGKGSLTHVSPVMREWRVSRKAELIAALEMPVELKMAIEGSLSQVWISASKLANANMESYRIEAQASVDSANAERDEAMFEIQHLEKRIDELGKALIDKDITISQINNILEEKRVSSGLIISENAALSAKMDDRDIQIKDLKADLKEARNDNKNLQKELVAIAKQV